MLADREPLDLDLDALEALALQAMRLAPGPWSAGSGPDPAVVGLWNGPDPETRTLLGVIGQSRQTADEQLVLARYIAALPPEVLLALVRELRARRERAPDDD
jgi:hypothetical protein